MSQVRQRSRSSHPTTRIAIGLLVIAALGLVGWFADPGLDAWTPSITVGALTVAMTITVVDHAVRRETQLRVQPRLDSVARAVRAPLTWLLWSIARDLVERRGHLDALPGDALSLTEAWIDEEVDAWEDTRPLPRNEDPPELLANALRLVTELEKIRSRDREVLEPVQVDELDEFVRMVEQARFLYDVVDPEAQVEARSALAILMRSIVYATHNLVLSLGVQLPALIDLDPSIARGLQQDVERRHRRKVSSPGGSEG